MPGALDARAKLASSARKEDEERDEKRLSKADRTARPTSSATFSTASTQGRRSRRSGPLSELSTGTQEELFDLDQQNYCPPWNNCPVARGPRFIWADICSLEAGSAEETGSY